MSDHEDVRKEVEVALHTEVELEKWDFHPKDHQRFQGTATKTVTKTVTKKGQGPECTFEFHIECIFHITNDKRNEGAYMMCDVHCLDAAGRRVKAFEKIFLETLGGRNDKFLGGTPCDIRMDPIRFQLTEEEFNRIVRATVSVYDRQAPSPAEKAQHAAKQALDVFGSIIKPKWLG